MSLNITGLVATIKDTNTYVPLVEAINNSIYSIEMAKRPDGEITVELIRDKTVLPLATEGDDEDAGMPDITTVRITDNGIGFTDDNLSAFDEAYTRHKVHVGGKGFGRFVYLKHFTDIRIDSTYNTNEGLRRRKFELGKGNDIVYDLHDVGLDDNTDTRTVIELADIRDGHLDKKLDTIARKLLEKILVQFVRPNFTCPKIRVYDEYSGNEVILNDLLSDSKYAAIEAAANGSFTIKVRKLSFDFNVHIFKIWFPGKQSSRISLASHYLEVTETPLDEYANEFEHGLVGEFENGNGERSSRYILKVYVTGAYLDDNVDRERVDFKFKKRADAFHPVGRADIEAEAAEIVKEKFKDEFTVERHKKLKKVENVTEERPWLKRYGSDLDLGTLRINSTESDYELALEVVRIRKDRELTLTAEKLVKSDARKLTDDKTEELIRDITQSNKDDLARYVARRKAVLDIFTKSLQYRNDGKHAAEKVVHDIIYPMKTDSEHAAPDYSNLWLLDERLNFTEFISSDKNFGDGNEERADLFIFHHQVAFRAGDDKQNPITIVEFKRPGREDFASQTHKENPVAQIVRYTNEIREGKYKMPTGRPIHTDKETQFYGFVIVDFTEKVKKWLSDEEDFIQMPDGLGYYKWRSQINLYIEVLSWDKVLKDAQLRNRIFAEKLGIF